ncbi:MAG: diaminopimelate epimerase, partial [Rhodopila sp.]
MPRMLTRFVKMHGCGNDFVIVDGRSSPLDLTPTGAAAIADRHTGIGCDQLIVLQPATPGCDVFMRIWNPDGSEAGACGNATRCVADILFRETQAGAATIRTISGELPARRLSDGQVEVDMGLVRLDWQDIPLSQPMDTLRLELSADGVSAPAAASMGNPHATFFVPDINAVPITRIGPLLEHAQVF